MSRLWSDEQIAYFQQHRDSAIQYLQALLPTSYFGHNAQKLTILLQANELIPTIIERYHVTKSKELLSITLQLMLQHNFLQQVAPKLYKTLYENESITRPNYLVYNDKNVQQVITLARQFYTNYPK
ncbi:hypothetical protein [Chitinophaga skermanii]|nr:hypothetical protein [Chitinophaga skermanii]